jgi:hypothetical protein
MDEGNMVLRVARAMEKADDGTTPFDVLARVAIEAMKEPTAEMLTAGMGPGIDGVWEAYSAMIDAALTPPPSGEM